MPLAFKIALLISVVLPAMPIVIVPWCVPLFIATKANCNVVYAEGPTVPAVAVTFIWACVFKNKKNDSNMIAIWRGVFISLVS